MRSRLWISSEETSISRLTEPSTQIAGFGSCAGLSQGAELDRRPDVEQMHAFRLLPIEQSPGFLFGHGHQHFERLVGEFEEVGGMDAAMMAEAFAGRNDRGAAQAHFTGQMHQPIGQGLAMVASVLLGKERDLVAVHEFLVR